MASNTELPSGYDYQFVEQVPEDYICSICHLVMRIPVQTKCGHQFCKDCLDAALKRKRKCPLDNKRLTAQQVFNDLAAGRKILSLKIKCPSQCDWQGELSDAKNHERECPMTTVTCNYLNIGCNFKGPRKSLSDHYKNNLVEHLAITTNQLLTLKDESKKQVEELCTAHLLEIQDENKVGLDIIKAEFMSLQDEHDKQVSRFITLKNESKNQVEELTAQLLKQQDENKMRLVKNENKVARLETEIAKHQDDSEVNFLKVLLSDFAIHQDISEMTVARLQQDFERFQDESEDKVNKLKAELVTIQKKQSLMTKTTIFLCLLLFAVFLVLIVQFKILQDENANLKASKKH